MLLNKNNLIRLIKLNQKYIIKINHERLTQNGGHNIRTSIGNFLRRIRMERNQRLKDMADILGVSSAFLSAVENGTKSMPESWVSKIQREYSITDSQCEEMRERELLCVRK